MFSFLLGLAAGTACVLNGPGTRRLLVTILAKGQQAATATARDAVRWSARLGEEIQDIVIEAKAEAAEEAARQNAGVPATHPAVSGSSGTSRVH
ncbi:MAG: hypothetical protein JOZ62_00970 [Acidobacteriaceae bacterium]|nr:hypothetical protein [Acidobacteriaceae bacterium]